MSYVSRLRATFSSDFWMTPLHLTVSRISQRNEGFPDSSSLAPGSPPPLLPSLLGQCINLPEPSTSLTHRDDLDLNPNNIKPPTKKVDTEKKIPKWLKLASKWHEILGVDECWCLIFKFPFRKNIALATFPLHPPTTSHPVVL